MKVIFWFYILWVLVLGCGKNQGNVTDIPSFKLDSFEKSDSMSFADLLEVYNLNSTERMSRQSNPLYAQNQAFFLVTYSPECPICLGNVSELKRIVRWIDSMGKQNVFNHLLVFVEQPLPRQYQWLKPYILLDSGFVNAKKFGFRVYPELKIVKNGMVRYSGKLNNKAANIGEKSITNRTYDSSYIWNQWLNCHRNRNTYYSSHEAVGCYIE